MRTCIIIISISLTILITACNNKQSERNQAFSADIVIYGGTSAAVIAAVQAKKMGKSVIVVSPENHLGGLTAGGLGWTDTGNKEVIGGLAGSSVSQPRLTKPNSSSPA